MFKPRSDQLYPGGGSPRSDQVLIDLQQIVKVYNTPSGGFTALKNVDLQVNAGEFVAVIGKSGSGKSTLINMITGIDRPTLGKVIVSGNPIHNLNEDQIAIWRGLNLGVIFQFFQLLPTLTVIENVMLPMELRNTYPRKERKERALHLLEQVELVDQAAKFPTAISGGQKQRVAIARALANNPDVLVGDEPTGSLDSKTADSIFRLFEDLASRGKTILIVTHDRGLASRVPRIVFLADGEITDQKVSTALPQLTHKELTRVSSQLEPIKYSAGETIIEQDAVADSFFIIVKGVVEIFLHHPSGSEMIVGRLQAGQYFGEIGLLEGRTRTATVKANPDSEVIVMQLGREEFARLVRDSDQTHSSIARLMSQRITIHHLHKVLPASTEEETPSKDIEHDDLTFEPGEIIFRKGDPADKFYIIMQGVVNVLHPYHEETIIDILTSGQYFGEGGIQQAQPRAYTVRANPEMDLTVKLMAIDADTFRQMIKGNMQFEEEIAMRMSFYLNRQLDD